MAPKLIFPTGTKAPDAELIDNIDSTALALSDTSSKQILSVSELRVQSMATTKRFTIEYNESEESLDFVFLPS